MTATQADTLAELQRANISLQAKLDAALAQRATEYGERIEHQAAAIDVLKAMSASPGDAQPVFDLIVERARAYCGAELAALTLLDGDLLRLQATSGMSAARTQEFSTAYPLPLSQAFAGGRAILMRDTVQVPDTQADPGFAQRGTNAWHRSVLAVPLLRAGIPIGAIGLGRSTPGAFSAAQVELLKTFAEQAVIAISSAETYRALQTRTADLQESLEYQTATSDVLKVISRSTFDLQPVLVMVAETAARLCAADQAAIIRHENGIIEMVGNFGFPPEYEALLKKLGPHRLVAGAPMVAYRAINERRVVHIHDVAAVSGYAVEPIKLGQQRTSLGVPLLRAGEPIGSILLARRRVEPFTDRQIELVNTFANQAVIAIENTRLITEQREALERQTATAEVLQVINASPGNLPPVFDAVLERALRLCGASFGTLATYDGERIERVAFLGVPPAFIEYTQQNPLTKNAALIAQGIATGKPVQAADILTDARMASSPDVRDALVELGGVRALLQVPMLKDGGVVGFIGVWRQEPGVFPDKQIALLEGFAAQAVIAMENARLITEQREALEQQTATAEVLQVINASPGNLVPVFDAMLEKAMRLCGVAFGMMTTFDGDRFHPIVWRGLPAALSAYFAEGGGPSVSSGMHGRLVAGAVLAHVVGMKDEEAYRSGYAARRALVDLGGAQTGLAIALRKDDALLGTFMLYRQEIRPFTDKQIALLQNFAAQAVIAMENARLLTETREALEQQTATAEVLQVINASPGNLAPVFDAILAKAMHLCGAAFGMFNAYDGTSFRTVVTRGVPAAFAAFRAKHPPTPSPGSPFGRAFETKRPVHIFDWLEEPAYKGGTPGGRAIADLGAARTVLNVPLVKDTAVLGMISFYRQQVRPFTDKQIALLENFAAQAVIAMENARLLTEQQEALEQQTATAEVLRVINTSPGDLGAVFDAMLEKALTLCGAEHGSLGTYDGDYFRAVASRGYPAAVLETLRGGFHGLENPVTRPLFDGARFVQIPDLGEIDHPIPKAIAALGGFRTVLFVPLRKDGKLLGHISASRQEVRLFAEKEITLLENFAAQAVIAMENARLLDEIRQRQAELRVTFENMGDGVAMFDETPSLVAWNRKFQDILDLPDGVLAERLAFPDYIRYLTGRGEYGAGADPEEQIRRLTEQAGEVRAYERTRPDGRVIEIRHNPVPGGGFVLIYADITERKRNEAEIRAARDAAEEASRTIEVAYRELKTAQANLIQAEKMASLGQLTAGIAHEIKNPLNFVNNFSALSAELVDELRDVLAPELLGVTARTEVDDLTALLKGNLEKVVQHGQRADGIVKAMLEHSRGSSGERRTVDLNALIDEALNLAYHGARAQDQSFNITLERDFGGSIAPIEVNPQDMTRVFLNLFSNGFYAANKRARNDGDAGFVPTLKVITRDADEAVEIRVRDNGTGIPADIRDKLFQPFFTTKPTGEGTGLGLSITYDIVTKQHGGNIAVNSAVGEYTEFRIRLPRNM